MRGGVGIEGLMECLFKSEEFKSEGVVRGRRCKNQIKIKIIYFPQPIRDILHICFMIEIHDIGH